MKRFIDIMVSVLVLLVLSPILIIVAIAIKLESKESIFFKQERVGLNGKVFSLLKFKSMKSNITAEKNFDFSLDEERITKVGKFIRRTKIDELPQLINVLKGDMSLVGPRPTIKKQVDAYNDYQRQRLNVRPGMTGLAQVNGNIYLDWDERIKYDVYYVRNKSLLLDLKILLKTVGVVVLGEDKFLNTELLERKRTEGAK